MGDVNQDRHSNTRDSFLIFIRIHLYQLQTETASIIGKIRSLLFRGWMPINPYYAAIFCGSTLLQLTPLGDITGHHVISSLFVCVRVCVCLSLCLSLTLIHFLFVQFSKHRHQYSLVKTYITSYTSFHKVAYLFLQQLYNFCI